MEPSPENVEKLEVRLDVGLSEILKSDVVPHLYANSFAIMHTNADVIVLLQQNGRPVGTLNLSFTLAKTLVGKLGKTISDLEASVEHSFPVTEDIDVIK